MVATSRLLASKIRVVMAQRVRTSSQTSIGVVGEAGPVAHRRRFDGQPVHVVVQRRRDVPQRVLHAQELAIDVIGVGGAETQRVDVGRRRPWLS